MTLTIDIPEDMMRWLRSEAAAKGKDVAAFVAESLTEAQARAEAKATLATLATLNGAFQSSRNPATRADVIAALGKQIYETKIKSRVESKHHGEYLVVDTESGDYAVAPTEDDALEQIEARRPRGVFYLLRIGYEASLFLGAKVK